MVIRRVLIGIVCVIISLYVYLYVKDDAMLFPGLLVNLLVYIDNGIRFVILKKYLNEKLYIYTYIFTYGSLFIAIKLTIV